MFPGDLRQLAERRQLSHLRFVVRIVNRAGTKAVAERERHVVRLHDLADVFEPLVEKRFAVMREAPLGHDRSAARHDAGHALRGHRNERQPNAGVNREVIDTLFGLFDQRVAKYLPRQLFGFAVDFFERLIDRHRADRHRRIAQNPFARLVNVLAGRQIHHRVRAPADRPRHLLDFFADRRRDRGVADVGVDLHQEIAADDHRLGFRMIDVGRNDRAAARDFVADELGRDPLRQLRAERLARMLAQHRRRLPVEPLVLADRDELHLRSHDATTRVMHLRDVRARHARATRMPMQVEAQLGELRIVQPIDAEARRRTRRALRYQRAL